MGRIDIPVNIELKSGVDTDNAKTTDDLGVIADLLRAQDQFIAIAIDVVEDPFTTSRAQCNRRT
ncbi:hypothetical protein D3C81_2252990 [compost metagenome]